MHFCRLFKLLLKRKNFLGKKIWLKSFLGFFKFRELKIWDLSYDFFSISQKKMFLSTRNERVCSTRFNVKSFRSLFFLPLYEIMREFKIVHPRKCRFPRGAFTSTLPIYNNCAEKFAAREIYEWKYTDETTRGRNASCLIMNVSAPHISIYKSWRLRKVTLAFSINFSIHVYIFIVSSVFSPTRRLFNRDCYSLCVFNNMRRETLLR